MAEPYIKPSQQLPELTLKVIILACILAIILAAANTFLALKIGILTSASIPAAILSMGILRFFNHANILENNLIQTGASAGEAIAGGVVYTAPALIIIGYWNHFNYWQTASLGLIGSMLGVLFSIPLRRILVSDPKLPFPEGRAIAEVLKFNLEHAAGFKQLLLGGAVGGLVELAQSGFHLISSQIQIWFDRNNTLYGFGFGFSATMIGAGYLIGFNIGLSIFIGALIGWIFGIPAISSYYHATDTDAGQAVALLYNSKIRYIGIGAMLIAGLWTLATLLKPFYISIKTSMQIFQRNHLQQPSILRTDKDMPFNVIIIGIVALSIWMVFLYQNNFQLITLGINQYLHLPFIICCMLYTIVFGFIFSAICGYFSGLVGITASPGSAIIIAGMLIAAFAIRWVLSFSPDISIVQLKHGAAITIFIGSIITGAACIANDNIQDLKVGYILGATPWKQQVMLLLGGIISALLIPLVMEILFNVYGIAGVMPRAGMDPSQQLPAPPAALMATITQGVFQHSLPWNMVGLGAIVIIIAIALNHFLKRNNQQLSILGIAIGMYLPISTSTPLFVGSLIALLASKKLNQQTQLTKPIKDMQLQRGLLLACGLVAGAALMDVIIAIPFAIAHNPKALSLLPTNWIHLANVLGVLTLISLAFWMYWTVSYVKSNSNSR